MKVVTFGEVMGRVGPPGLMRFRQALPGMVEVTFGGAEANVAVALALLGGEARFVSALPKHTMADACIDRLRGLGVDTQFILRTDTGRLGLYFSGDGADSAAQPGDLRSRGLLDRPDSRFGLRLGGDPGRGHVVPHDGYYAGPVADRGQCGFGGRAGC